MDIRIPDKVRFQVAHDDQWRADKYLCFRHAVVRATQGANVETFLTEEWFLCDDCRDERDA